MDFTVSPAYGRDYTSAKAAVEGWNSGNDFQIHAPLQWAGTYCSNRDLPSGSQVKIRYGKLRKCIIVEVK